MWSRQELLFCGSIHGVQRRLGLPNAAAALDQIVCLDDGQSIGSVPRPNPASLGLDPLDVVTNAVSIEKDLMFISNGGAGIYVAQGSEEFKDTDCNAQQQITVLGKLRFDDFQSVNQVEFENDHLIIAAGLSGVKVVRVDVD